MKVIYISQLCKGSTSLARADVLRDKGYTVIPFDICDYFNKGSHLRFAIQDRLLNGPDVRNFNRDLILFVLRVGKVDTVWVDKGTWVYLSTLKQIKKITGAYLVHYTPDPAFHVHTSRHFSRSLTLYDLCITTKRYEIQRYYDAGAQNVIFTWQGFDDRFINSVKCSVINGSLRNGIVFVGHCEKYYQHVFGMVAQIHPCLSIWGPGWERVSRKQPLLAACVKGGPVWDDEYVRVLSGAQIGIGLLSKYYPDQFTTRSFEIPAAGTMLLAERTADHQELFEEGRDADFFSSTEELNDKITFYLNNEVTRSGIARCGRSRVLSCFHWRQVLLPALRIIEDAVA